VALENLEDSPKELILWYIKEAGFWGIDEERWEGEGSGDVASDRLEGLYEMMHRLGVREDDRRDVLDYVSKVRGLVLINI
jgi:hypothetical protein